jgi:aromatic-L-amino-acid decarboxylase
MQEKRSAPLEITGTDFRTLGHHLVDWIGDFLDKLPELPVTSGETPAEIRKTLNAELSLPDDGSDPAKLLEHTAALLFDHSLFNSHPRFWGYITAPAAPIGILGDFLAAAVNANSGAWFLSPMASEIEVQTIRWIAQLLNYPVNCGGILVSGGNMANMVGLLAARQAKAGWDARTEGLYGGKAQRLKIYCSKETHTWVHKAADLSGVGTDGIRWISTDKDLCMDVDELRKQIHTDREAGEQPFIVIGTAGSVSTGAIDPLDEIASVCREEDLWFHVDGAYGGFPMPLPVYGVWMQPIRSLSIPTNGCILHLKQGAYSLKTRKNCAKHLHITHLITISA